MSTQRTFKRRVRARMTKTGESYTSARSQLIRKAGSALPNEPGGLDLSADPLRAANTAEPTPRADEPMEATGSGAARSADEEAIDPALLPTSDESMRRATGRSYDEWFVLLDRWGAREKSHTETAAWLVADQSVAGWWAQGITVGYERARGLRAIHQMTGGYSVGANRTIAMDSESLFAAVMEGGRQAGWLRESPVPRSTYQGLGIRFPWTDPPSRVAIFVAEKGPHKATISVQHEKLPDAEAGERLKTHWRDWLRQLKAQLESGTAV